MLTSTITVAGISPNLNILGATQQLNYNQELSILQLNNSFIPTSLISAQTNLEFQNNLLSGYRLIHLTTNTDTYGSFTLQSFVNASSTGTNLISCNSSRIQFYNVLGIYSNFVTFQNIVGIGKNSPTYALHMGTDNGMTPLLYMTNTTIPSAPAANDGIFCVVNGRPYFKSAGTSGYIQLGS